MNKYSRECGKNIGKSAVDCLSLIGNPSVLGIVSCGLSLKETFDPCKRLFSGDSQKEIQKSNFKPRSWKLMYYRDKEIFDDEDLSGFNMQIKIPRIILICQKCQHKQILWLNSNNESMIKCPNCGDVSNFLIKR